MTNRLAFSLIMDLTNQAPIGPGWYMIAAMDGQTIVGPLSVKEKDAETIGQAFQVAMPEFDKPGITFGELIVSGHNLIRQSLEQRLKQAESMAAEIPSLRKRLAVYDEKATESANLKT